jgi:SAM-dependent methyltransferase
VYRLGDALTLPFADSSFDVVTAWNVFEHVSDLEALLHEVRRVLRPGGSLLAIAPNYASLRREAHYHVFLPPLLPRTVAASYLRWRGRNPDFFDNHVFYRTNRSVAAALRAAGFDSRTPQHQLAKLRTPATIRRGSVRRALGTAQRLGLTRGLTAMVAASYRNPLRRRIDVHARRPEDR